MENVKRKQTLHNFIFTKYGVLQFLRYFDSKEAKAIGHLKDFGNVPNAYKIKCT
jgi:hypothetical protein